MKIPTKARAVAARVFGGLVFDDVAASFAIPANPLIRSQAIPLICECYGEEEADLIAAALNAHDKARTP